MKPEDEIRLRAEVACKLTCAMYDNDVEYRQKDRYKLAIDMADEIVDNAIKKSYGVMKMAHS